MTEAGAALFLGAILVGIIVPTAIILWCIAFGLVTGKIK